MKSACCIANDNIAVLCLCRRNCVINYCGRVAALVLLNNVCTASLCPDIQLVNSSGTECIGGSKSYLFAALHEVIGKLTDGCGFANTVNTDYKDNRRRCAYVKLLTP